MLYPLKSDLESLVEQRLVTKRKHPELPLWIYNYSPAAASLKPAEWSPALCDARGLILDDEGNIIARPFKKFWNLEQVIDQIPGGIGNWDWVAYEKLDGSLGIFCNYQGQLVVATRGSFESEQAKWAANYLRNHNPKWVPAPGLTYLAEIIYPENRIVVDYQGAERLVLLAINDQTGTDVVSLLSNDLALPAGFERVRIKCNGLGRKLESLAEDETPGDEGYVVRWRNGFRAKVKFTEYKRLHRLITQCSTRTIWELLMQGKELEELREGVPIEFLFWVDGVAGDLLAKHQTIFLQVSWAFRNRMVMHPGESRKEFAAWAKTQEHSHLLFAMLDSKPVDELIWKCIEPKWTTPFKTNRGSTRRHMSSTEFGKINTLFERQPDFTVDPTKLKDPTVACVARWDVTEKVDGTNIRIERQPITADFDDDNLPPASVRVKGRTDNANLPGDLVTNCKGLFETAAFANYFPQAKVTLYGEGYGAGIQKVGRSYAPTKKFILFDVRLDWPDGRVWWLNPADVREAGQALGCDVVPYLGHMELDDIVMLVKSDFRSNLADIPAEGIVARPNETLFDRNGDRVIIKLKGSDFRAGKR